MTSGDRRDGHDRVERVPERETTVLQHVDLEADPATQKLYFRYWDPAGKLAALSDEDRSLHIEAGLTVSFDAYFNSFYARYWDECTSVSTVKLRLRLTGRGAVSVFRQSRDGAIDEAGRLPFDSSAATTIEVPLPDFAGGADPSGRFWFDVHASTDCTVYGGEWVTSDPPVRQVSPSVVFCTYNRVGYLSRIMRVLADRKDVYAEISRIYIVNQGDRFELSDLVTGVSEDFLSRVEVIEQTNLGGCGGFSRGMYETLKRRLVDPLHPARRRRPAASRVAVPGHSLHGLRQRRRRVGWPHARPRPSPMAV